MNTPGEVSAKRAPRGLVIQKWITIVVASLLALSVAIFGISLRRAQNESRERRCPKYLKSVGFGVSQYVKATGRNTDLNVLSILNERPDLMSRFSGVCPTKHPTLTLALPISPEDSDYEYLSSFDDMNYNFDLPIVWDKKGNHAGGRNVVFLNEYNSRFLTEDEFQKLMGSLRVNESKKTANNAINADK